MAEFNPGQKGSFSDKRKEIKRCTRFLYTLLNFSLLDRLDWIILKFVMLRRDCVASNAVTIFDVWPRDTLDELLDTEQLASRRPQLG